MAVLSHFSVLVAGEPELQPFITGTMNGDGTGDQPSAPRGGVRRVEGTNVVRVAFGVRRARRARPERPDHWATLVLPFHGGGGGGPTPPQAA
jgi:hypothetical protein